MSQRRILFIAQHRPNRSPSQRFRFEQYLEHLRSSGYEYEFSYLIDEAADKVLYTKGRYEAKARILADSFKRRQDDAVWVNQFDIVFVQREAFMTRNIIFERKFSKSPAKFIFDFDDSIWLHNVSEANRSLKFLKGANKTARIIPLADHVIAGNQYLADYALRFNDKVSIIPTTIDTEAYRPISQTEERNVITIGWSGSITTIQHFNLAVSVLQRIKDVYGDRIAIKVIGDAEYRNPALGIEGQGWNANTEIEDLCEMDIGIMPLPDDEWVKGKCGLKGLQYMALEIPTIMSPVGVNTEIIQDGENGFLAAHEDEWFEKLSKLIDDPALRVRLGKAGRKTVENQYSVKANLQHYMELFDRVLA
ncbi:MAG: glycosyltransferase family 4 protein [Flavobacteriales bacterium]|nr:glycosyltransferase family 4 protein [Flavobacteriales bacterium]